MDTAIAAFLVLATCSALYERLVEVVRQACEEIGTKLYGDAAWPRGTWLKELFTEKGFNLVLGVMTANLMNASFFDLFRYERAPGSSTTSAPEMAFFHNVGHIGGWSAADMLGYALLGAGVTLGSQFWHDLVFGLRDVRNRAREVPKTSREQITAALGALDRDVGTR